MKNILKKSATSITNEGIHRFSISDFDVFLETLPVMSPNKLFSIKTMSVENSSFDSVQHKKIPPFHLLMRDVSKSVKRVGYPLDVTHLKIIPTGCSSFNYFIFIFQLFQTTTLI
jgi:hypothetical protein